MSPRILLVDDEANIRKMVSALLESEGFETLEAPNGQAALALVAEDAPDAVLLDLMMPPGPDGLATLEQLKKRAPHVPVVMMSGKANLADAVRATKLGAFQFLEKPLTPEGILVALRGALELGRTLAENRRLHEQLGHADPLVGTSVAMDELRAMIARVAPTESRVLITGESGTGKELVASAIHRQSARGGAGKPFVTVNSAAIPRDLVESEMFGHERGAFTGATERRQGRFELADGGTLFLDEVGDLSAEAQAKLLRVLETGVVERLGSERPFTVNVRVIAATNKELASAVRQRQFREDLWFRLNVLPIHIPPLRERPDDVPPLVRHCAARCAARLGRAVRFDAGALQLLAAYRWPGNVRELANIVERLAILAPGGGETITANDVARVLPNSQDGGRAATGSPPPPTPGGETAWRDVALAAALDQHERELIARALSAARGNVAEAARRLSTDRANLYRRMRRLGIEPPRNVTG
jgi:two-component system nitrogen regulation response regulator NtrX